MVILYIVIGFILFGVIYDFFAKKKGWRVPSGKSNRENLYGNSLWRVTQDKPQQDEADKIDKML